MRIRKIAVVLAGLALLASTGSVAAAPRKAAKSSAMKFATLTVQNGGGEPSIAISPNGRNILISGLVNGTAPATFVRSTDGGRSFKLITPTFAKSGGFDWDMHWINNNTLIAVDLSPGSDGIIMDRSEDAGMTWSSATVVQDVYDRPWVDHFGKDKIYVVSKGTDGIPYLYSSSDGGRSFGLPVIPIVIYGTDVAHGQDPINSYVINQNSYVDHLVVDPHSGDVYVLYGVDGSDSFTQTPTGLANRLYVAHLENGAMVSRPVYIGGASDGFIAGFNWMCVDASGTLYVIANGVTNGRTSTYLTYSRDKGVTWSPLKDVGIPGGSNVYGSIAAGSPGTLSLFSLHGTNTDPANTKQDWFAEMAMIRNANTSRPSVTTTRPVSKPIHQADICFSGIACTAPGGGNRNLLDFISNAIGPDGRAFGVTASDGPATDDTSTGTAVSILMFEQIGGARFGRGSQS